MRLAHLKAQLRTYLDPTVLPSQCVVCQRWPQRVVCAQCWHRFAPADRGARLRGHIRRDGFEWAWAAALDYQYPWDGLIGSFKFQAQMGLAAHLAKMMLASPQIVAVLAHCDYLIPVPIHPERLATRGYNQAALLAHSLIKAYALLSPEQAGQRALPTVLDSALLRAQAGLDQVGLHEAERWDNVKRTFVLAPLTSPLLQSRHIVVLDDIMTTGATLHACIQAALKAKPATIAALALAKTL